MYNQIYIDIHLLVTIFYFSEDLYRNIYSISNEVQYVFTVYYVVVVFHWQTICLVGQGKLSQVYRDRT
jgi:hypothetical protein